MARPVDVDRERKWRNVMHRFATSGMGFKKFCAIEKISPSTFQVWRRKLRELDEQRGGISGVPKKADPANEWAQKIAYWKDVIAKARKHPKGVAGYCRQNKIAPQSLYEWLRRIKQTEPDWNPPPVIKGTETASQMFVPVSLLGTPHAEKSAQRIESNEPQPGESRIELRLPSGCLIFLPHTMQTGEVVALLKALGGK